MTSRPSIDHRARHLSSFYTNADLAPRLDKGTPFAPPWVRINSQRPAEHPAPVHSIRPGSGREVLLQVGCQFRKGRGEDTHIIGEADGRNQVGNGINRAHERDEGRDHDRLAGQGGVGLREEAPAHPPTAA